MNDEKSELKEFFADVVAMCENKRFSRYRLSSQIKGNRVIVYDESPRFPAVVFYFKEGDGRNSLTIDGQWNGLVKTMISECGSDRIKQFVIMYGTEAQKRGVDVRESVDQKAA